MTSVFRAHYPYAALRPSSNRSIHAEEPLHKIFEVVFRRKGERKMTGKHRIVPCSEMLQKEDQRKGSSTILQVPMKRSMEVGYMKG
jgi:hypothetical protein